MELLVGFRICTCLQLVLVLQIAGGKERIKSIDDSFIYASNLNLFFCSGREAFRRPLSPWVAYGRLWVVVCGRVVRSGLVSVFVCQYRLLTSVFVHCLPIFVIREYKEWQGKRANNSSSSWRSPPLPLCELV